MRKLCEFFYIRENWGSWQMADDFMDCQFLFTSRSSTLEVYLQISDQIRNESNSECIVILGVF